MDEKNIMELDSAEGIEEKTALAAEGEAIEGADTDLALGGADANLALDGADANLALEGAGDTTENAELGAEDALCDEAENTNLAIEDEDAIAKEVEDYDIKELKESFPELSSIGSVSELLYADKYRKFRALGLSPKEAFLATGQAIKPKRAIPSSPISVARQRDGIPNHELKYAREIFTDLCDREIQELYKKVSK